MTVTSDTTKAIIDYLNFLGHYVWRNQTVGRVGGFAYSSKRGIGDIVGMLNDGTHIEIEVKTGRDRASEYQLQHADKVHLKHGIHIFAKTFDDFERQFKQLLPRSLPGTATSSRTSGVRGNKS